MRLCREIQDEVVSLGEKRIDDLRVGDVSPHEPVSVHPVEGSQVRRIARIGELVEDRDLRPGIATAQMVDEVRTDESRPSGHEVATRLDKLIALGAHPFRLLTRLAGPRSTGLRCRAGERGTRRGRRAGTARSEC